jgi:LuxR family maltose regulon positive regulatory protein
LAESGSRATPASGVALTKFRVPRVRRDALPRAALVERLADAVRSNPLTAVVAPAGYGKTTILAQLVAALGTTPVAWVSVDEDDDDPNRFFATLVRALQPFDLAFDEDPVALVASVTGAGAPARAAVGTLVNALCTSAAPRLVVVLDDLHRAAHPDVGALLEAFVERLPDHVSLVLAGRALPALPLARWVVRGEAEEFGPDRLGFDAGDVGALLARQAPDVDAAEVARLLDRTRGWPAGVAMLLRASPGAGAASASPAQLFDYLADEVLRALPDELRRFALDVAVLGELTPAACATVADRPDAASLLRALHERDLFVTLLDAAGPVLRYHDLFREFLLSRLQADGARLAALHVRAAGAEASSLQAVAHWLAAGRWSEALARLLDVADELFREGGHAAVERWLERFPAGSAEGEPALHYMRGVCAWRRWDWFRSYEALQRAADLLTPEAPPRLRARTLLYLMGSRSALGDRDGALQVAAEVGRLPLEDAERAVLALQSAWCRMGRGECERVVQDLRTAVDLVARDPVRSAPATADNAHSVYIGLPGALDAYRRLVAAYDLASGGGVAPWHGAPAVITGWVRLWEGDHAGVAASVERAREVLRRFSIPPLEDGLARLEATFLAASGRGEQALAISRRLVARFDAAAPGPLRVVFESAYVHGLMRAAWAAADRDAFRAALPRASRPPRREEWAFCGVATRMVVAQATLLDGEWARAADAFAALLPEHERVRCPAGMSDPRFGLAYARLQQGRADAALSALRPALDESAAEESVGALLLEPAWLVDPLMRALPPAWRAEPPIARLCARLERWRADAALPAAAVEPAGPLSELSDREREVLQRVAQGASNKEIARELDLSLHTVKRHVANILGKLDCVSRRQAAELVRRHG